METREEQIKNEAKLKCHDIASEVDYKSLAAYDGFVMGAEWADEHPNLYNDEKYHTVKVSCLDELNRKAQLFDEFLKKACDYLYKLNQMNFKEYGRHCPLVNVCEFRKAMEECEVYSR